MGLDMILRIALGAFLFSIFGQYINVFFYYLLYAVKFVYSVVDFLFSFLGTTALWKSALFAFFFFWPLVFLVAIIQKFLK